MGDKIFITCNFRQLILELSHQGGFGTRYTAPTRVTKEVPRNFRLKTSLEISTVT